MRPSHGYYYHHLLTHWQTDSAVGTAGSVWISTVSPESRSHLLEGVLEQRLSGHGDLHVAGQGVGLRGGGGVAEDNV